MTSILSLARCETLPLVQSKVWGGGISSWDFEAQCVDSRELLPSLPLPHQLTLMEMPVSSCSHAQDAADFLQGVALPHPVQHWLRLPDGWYPMWQKDPNLAYLEPVCKPSKPVHSNICHLFPPRDVLRRQWDSLPEKEDVCRAGEVVDDGNRLSVTLPIRRGLAPTEDEIAASIETCSDRDGRFQFSRAVYYDLVQPYIGVDRQEDPIGLATDRLRLLYGWARCIDGFSDIKPWHLDEAICGAAHETFNPPPEELMETREFGYGDRERELFSSVEARLNGEVSPEIVAFLLENIETLDLEELLSTDVITKLNDICRCFDNGLILDRLTELYRAFDSKNIRKPLMAALRIVDNVYAGKTYAHSFSDEYYEDLDEPWWFIENFDMVTEFFDLDHEGVAVVGDELKIGVCEEGVRIINRITRAAHFAAPQAVRAYKRAGYKLYGDGRSILNPAVAPDGIFNLFIQVVQDFGIGCEERAVSILLMAAEIGPDSSYDFCYFGDPFAEFLSKQKPSSPVVGALQGAACGIEFPGVKELMALHAKKPGSDDLTVEGTLRELGPELYIDGSGYGSSHIVKQLSFRDALMLPAPGTEEDSERSLVSASRVEGLRSRFPYDSERAEGSGAQPYIEYLQVLREMFGDDSDLVAKVTLGALGDQGVHPLMEGLPKAMYCICKMDQYTSGAIGRKFGLKGWATDDDYRVDVARSVFAPLFTLHREGVLDDVCLERCVRNFSQTDRLTPCFNSSVISDFSLMCTNLVDVSRFMLVDLPGTIAALFNSVCYGDGHDARRMRGFNNLLEHSRMCLEEGVLKEDDMPSFYAQFCGYLTGEEELDFRIPSCGLMHDYINDGIQGLIMLFELGIVSYDIEDMCRVSFLGYACFGIGLSQELSGSLYRLAKFTDKRRDVIEKLVSDGFLVFNTPLDNVTSQFLDEFQRAVYALNDMLYYDDDIVGDMVEFTALLDEDLDFVCVDPAKVQQVLAKAQRTMFKQMLLGGAQNDVVLAGNPGSEMRNAAVAARMSIDPVTSVLAACNLFSKDVRTALPPFEGLSGTDEEDVSFALARFSTSAGICGSDYQNLFDQYNHLKVDMEPRVRAFVVEQIKAAIGMLPIGLKVHVSRDGNDKFNPTVLNRLLHSVGVSETGGFKLDDADTALVMNPFPSYGQLKLFLQYLGVIGITNASYAEFQLTCPGELDNDHAAYLGAAVLLTTNTNSAFNLRSFYTNRSETRGKLIIPSGQFTNIKMPFMPESLKNSSDRTDIVCRLDPDDAEIVQWVHTMLMYHQLGTPLHAVHVGRTEMDISEYWMMEMKRLLTDARLGGVLDAPWIRGGLDHKELFSHFREGVSPCVDAWKYDDKLVSRVQDLNSETREMFKPRQAEILASNCEDVCAVLGSIT